MPIQSAVDKMDKNPAYPSPTAYFYGMTEEENASLPFPLPPVAECIVAGGQGMGVTIARNAPKGRTVKIPAHIFIDQALREKGLSEEQARIIWT